MASDPLLPKLWQHYGINSRIPAMIAGIPTMMTSMKVRGLKWRTYVKLCYIAALMVYCVVV